MTAKRKYFPFPLFDASTLFENGRGEPAVNLCATVLTASGPRTFVATAFIFVVPSWDCYGGICINKTVKFAATV